MIGLPAALALLAALSAGGVAYALLFGRMEQERTQKERLDKIQNRRSAAERARVRATVDPAKRRKTLQDTLKELEEKGKPKAKKQGISLNRRLEQAGLHLSRRAFYIISAVVGLVALLICVVSGLPVYAALAAGIAGAFGLPRWIVNRMRKKRLEKFQEEFANAVDVIVRGVKAGLPLNDCLQIVAREAEAPVRDDFQRVVEAQKMGMSIADAIDRMPDRVPIAEVNFFAIVIGIQQRAGGNLSEALGNLSRVLRDRKRMKGKISAMSMEAKASAAIIAALPFIVMFLVFLTSPDYIALLFTEKMGHLMLGAGAIWMTAGVLVMRKMINFDF